VTADQLTLEKQKNVTLLDAEHGDTGCTLPQGC
jgi:hypothetical protein